MPLSSHAVGAVVVGAVVVVGAAAEPWPAGDSVSTMPDDDLYSCVGALSRITALDRNSPSQHHGASAAFLTERYQELPKAMTLATMMLASMFGACS